MINDAGPPSDVGSEERINLVDELDMLDISSDEDDDVSTAISRFMFFHFFFLEYANYVVISFLRDASFFNCKLHLSLCSFMSSLLLFLLRSWIL